MTEHQAPWPLGEVLAGIVERVTFHNAESGFAVLRVKARGHRAPVTIVGHAAAIAAGEWITATGEWVNDRTHGQQFWARFLKTSAPTTAEGIERYLASGMIRGIGPVYAKKLVRGFGEAVFDIIEGAPQRLREVGGIGEVRAKRIVDAWAEQKVIREIMVFLHSHGVGTARAVRIFKTYGADAIQVMSENPYRLARDIRGIGFKTADAIAARLGIEKTAMIRVRAGIGYALSEAMDEGHCGLPVAELIPLAERLLEVPEALIRTALDLELAAGAVNADRVGETDCIFLAGLYHAERGIAERLRAVAVGALPWPWRSGCAGASLCGDDPQGAGLGIPSRGDPGADAALHHAATEPALYRHHPRQAAGRARRQPEGGGHRGGQCLGPAALVEAAGMAGCVAGWSGRLVTLSTGPLAAAEVGREQADRFRRSSQSPSLCAGADCCGFRRDTIQRGHQIVRQTEFGCGEVLPKVCRGRGAGDQKNVG